MGTRFSAPVQTGRGAHPASCTMGTGSFPGVKRGRGVRLTTHPLLVPWSRKSRAIPLIPLWVVRPVQGCTLPYPQCPYKGDLYLTLSACTRVHFTLPSVPVQGCTLLYPRCLYKGALYFTLSACTRVTFTLPSVAVQGCNLPYPQFLYKGALYLTLSACTRVHFTLPS